MYKMLPKCYTKCLFFCASNPLNLICIRCKIKEPQLLRLMFPVHLSKKRSLAEMVSQISFFSWLFNAAALNRKMAFMPIFYLLPSFFFPLLKNMLSL